MTTVVNVISQFFEAPCHHHCEVVLMIYNIQVQECSRKYSHLSFMMYAYID